MTKRYEVGITRTTGTTVEVEAESAEEAVAEALEEARSGGIYFDESSSEYDSHEWSYNPETTPFAEAQEMP